MTGSQKIQIKGKYPNLNKLEILFFYSYFLNYYDYLKLFFAVFCNLH